MSNYIITTDSGCDLSAELYEKYDIRPIMMEYESDGETFQDSLDPEKIKEFYNTMREGAVPKTSQINSDRMMGFFEEIAKEGKDILHIALGSGISGTYHNATIAAKEVSEKCGIRIIVVDSLGASLSYGMLNVIASDNRKKGMTIEENAENLNDVRHNVNVYYTTNTLTYLHRGGRVSKTSAVLGQMLGINPVLTLDKEGKLIVCDKVRGEKNTFANIREKMAGNVIDPQNQTLYISQSDCRERAEKVGEEIRRELGFAKVEITSIGAIIGAHTGPGLIAIFYLGKPREL